jgi:sulfate permease, SulP family
MQMKSLMNDASAGLVASLLSIAYCFSFGALIFSGPLQPFLNVGIAAALTTAAVTGVLITLTSGFKMSVSGPDGNTVALLAALTGGLAPEFASLPPGDALTLALAALLATTLATGIILYLLGLCRLGRFGRFVPYPMLAGFLGASGWLMVTGSIRMVTDLPVSFGSLMGFARLDMLAPLAVTAGWAAVLWGATGRIRHFAALPVTLIGGILAADFLLHGPFPAPFGIRAAEWMFTVAPSDIGVALPAFDRPLWHADWLALVSVGGTVAAAALMAALSIIMNSTGIEQVVQTDIDLDRELRIEGIANIVTALAGGFIGYVSMSRTLLARTAGGAGRFAGIVVAAVSLVMLAGGVHLIGYVPRFILGGLLMQLGARLMWNWCVASRKRLPTAEWLLVPVIVVMTAWFGVLIGFAVGILGGCAIFAFSVSRVDIVRRYFGAEERPSSLVRSTEEMALLAEQGHDVRVVELGSFIFFGSAYRLQEQVAAQVKVLQPRMVIFDFSAVSGIDSSAGSSFLRIAQRLREARVRHVVTGLAPSVRRIMAEAGALAGTQEYASLDEALEAGETMLLEQYGFTALNHRPLLDWFTEALGNADHARDLVAALEPANPVDEHYLCRQGDDTDSLLFVERGRLSVVVERPDQAPIRHRVFGANTVVGEIGFFLDVPRTASLRLDRDTEVWALGREAFERLKLQQPDLTAALLTYTVRTQAERLSFATRQIAALQR